MLSNVSSRPTIDSAQEIVGRLGQSMTRENSEDALNCVRCEQWEWGRGDTVVLGGPGAGKDAEQLLVYSVFSDKYLR